MKRRIERRFPYQHGAGHPLSIVRLLLISLGCLVVVACTNTGSVLSPTSTPTTSSGPVSAATTTATGIPSPSTAVDKQARISEVQLNRDPPVTSQVAFGLSAPPMEGTARLAYEGVFVIVRIKNERAQPFLGHLERELVNPDGRVSVIGSPFHSGVSVSIDANSETTFSLPIYEESASLGVWGIRIKLFQGATVFSREVVDEKQLTIEIKGNESPAWPSPAISLGNQVALTALKPSPTPTSFELALRLVDMVARLLNREGRGIDTSGIGLTALAQAAATQAALDTAQLDLSFADAQDQSIKATLRYRNVHGTYNDPNPLSGAGNNQVWLSYDRAVVTLMIPDDIQVLDTGGADIVQPVPKEGAIQLVWIRNYVDSRFTERMSLNAKPEVSVVLRNLTGTPQSLRSALLLQHGPFPRKPAELAQDRPFAEFSMIKNFALWQENPTTVWWITVGADYRSGDLPPAKQPELPSNVDVELTKLVSVTLRVVDEADHPIKGAEVKAFSERWGFRIPNFSFGRTDAAGKYTLQLTPGTWSFFAGIGYGTEFANSNPGKGYFMTAPGVKVTQDTEITLRPDVTLRLEVLSPEGLPLHGGLRMMDTTHVPIVPAPYIGKTDFNGRIVIYATKDLAYDFLFFTFSGTTTDYVYYKTGTKPNARLSSSTEPPTIIRPGRSSLSLLRFNSMDPQGNPAKGDVSINYHYFNVGENTGLYPVMFPLEGRRDVFITPSLVRVNHRLFPDKWYFLFAGRDLDLKGGETLDLPVGGATNVQVKVMTENTQMWLDVRDQWGNRLDFFGDPVGEAHVPVTLTKDGTTVFNDDIGKLVGWNNALSAGRLNKTFAVSDGIAYHIKLNLGPLGNHDLNGELLSPGTLLKFEHIETPHFAIEAPEGFHDHFKALADFLEEAYRAESDFIGLQVQDKIKVQFAIAPQSAGAAGLKWITMGIGFTLSDSTKILPSTPLFVASHELGHVFQMSTFQESFFAERWIGEPFATMLGYAAIGNVLGQRIQLFGEGSHDNVLQWLSNRDSLDQGRQIENVYFLLLYLRNKYGVKIHQDFARYWAAPELRKGRETLTKQGFTTDERIVGIYSHLAGENLGWLFQLAGINVSDERIQAANQALYASSFSSLPSLTPTPGSTTGQPPSLDVFAPEVSGFKVSINGVTLPGTSGATGTRIHWDWGDGTSEDRGFPASHTYSAGGNYMVTVTSYQSDGLTTVKTLAVRIS